MILPGSERPAMAPDTVPVADGGFVDWAPAWTIIDERVKATTERRILRSPADQAWSRVSWIPRAAPPFTF